MTAYILKINRMKFKIHDGTGIEDERFFSVKKHVVCAQNSVAAKQKKCPTRRDCVYR
jgi:hypothetical protein